MGGGELLHDLDDELLRLGDVVGRGLPAGLGEDVTVRVDHSPEYLGAPDVDADRQTRLDHSDSSSRLARGLARRGLSRCLPCGLFSLPS